MKPKIQVPLEAPFAIWQKRNQQILQELNADRDSTLLLYKFSLAKKRPAQKKALKESLPDMFKDIAHKAVEYGFWSISQGQRHYKLTWSESRAICFKMQSMGIIKFNGYYVTDILIKSHRQLMKCFNS